jgi:hypothetical protein
MFQDRENFADIFWREGPRSPKNKSAELAIYTPNAEVIQLALNKKYRYNKMYRTGGGGKSTCFPFIFLRRE